jgi:hypothetical protein
VPDNANTSPHGTDFDDSHGEFYLDLPESGEIDSDQPADGVFVVANDDGGTNSDPHINTPSELDQDTGPAQWDTSDLDNSDRVTDFTPEFPPASSTPPPDTNFDSHINTPSELDPYTELPQSESTDLTHDLPPAPSPPEPGTNSDQHINTPSELDQNTGPLQSETTELNNSDRTNDFTRDPSSTPLPPESDLSSDSHINTPSELVEASSSPLGDLKMEPVEVDKFVGRSEESAVALVRSPSNVTAVEIDSAMFGTTRHSTTITSALIYFRDGHVTGNKDGAQAVAFIGEGVAGAVASTVATDEEAGTKVEASVGPLGEFSPSNEILSIGSGQTIPTWGEKI